MNYGIISFICIENTYAIFYSGIQLFVMSLLLTTASALNSTRLSKIFSQNGDIPGELDMYTATPQSSYTRNNVSNALCYTAFTWEKQSCQSRNPWGSRSLCGLLLHLRSFWTIVVTWKQEGNCVSHLPLRDKSYAVRFLSILHGR